MPENITEFDERRKKLYFRSCRRGIREMDILFSAFALAVLSDLPASALDEYERLLDMADADLLAWGTGRAPVPQDQRFPLLDRFINFAERHPC